LTIIAESFLLQTTAILTFQHGKKRESINSLQFHFSSNIQRNKALCEKNDENEKDSSLIDKIFLFFFSLSYIYIHVHTYIRYGITNKSSNCVIFHQYTITSRAVEWLIGFFNASNIIFHYATNEQKEWEWLQRGKQ
jgi:hypothetical protein